MQGAWRDMLESSSPDHVGSGMQSGTFRRRAMAPRLQHFVVLAF